MHAYHLPAPVRGGYFNPLFHSTKRMPEELHQQLERLQQLNLSVRRSLEAAELYIPQINRQIDQLVLIGLLEPTMHLGDIIYESRYNPAYGAEDSTRLLQAALAPGFGGIGVSPWNSEDYWRFVNFNGSPQAEAIFNFLPFEHCSSAVKGLLVPRVQPLVVRACELLRA